MNNQNEIIGQCDSGRSLDNLELFEIFKKNAERIYGACNQEAEEEFINNIKSINERKRMKTQKRQNRKIDNTQILK